MGKIGFALMGVAGIMVGGFGIPSAPANHITLDRHGEPFRSAFNADTGKTRIVMLVAPT